MSRSLINVVNTVAGTTITDGGVYPLPQTLRRFGCDIVSNGVGVTCKNAGYYRVTGSVTAVAGAAGVAKVQVYVNGTAYTGATSSLTVASGETFSLPVDTVIRVNCCANPADITLVLSGLESTSTNAELTVSKE